jgi:UDP-N-acetylglucosamine--N-acetylmuramyl-(pentapeptide) pyrophosphoryl-undecaprenol N-acetylglucosamine transferase
MKKIVITTGGTGGHIFPAISTAKYLMEQNCNLYLLTDSRGVKWSDKNIPIYNVPSSQISGTGITGKSKAGFKITYGFFKARKHLKNIKPDAIVGFGGYASFPVVFAGYMLKIPIILHEQNAYAGRANRMLSRFAKIVATAFPKTLALKAKTIHTGNPIRTEIKALYKNIYLRNNDNINVLVTGGSQGAKIFGEVIPSALLKYKDKMTITHQTRPEQLEEIKTFYKKHNMNASVKTFIANMSDVLKETHLAICRSGAGTVMENSCAGIPTIYVPYKYAANNHQYYNAKSIADAGGGIIINQDDFSQQALQKVIDSIIVKDKLEQMSKCAKSFAVINADELLGNTILENIRK